MPPAELTLRARFVFPGDAPPIENGCVHIAGDRILMVGQCDAAHDLDFGNAAIVPGFVNAHTHLELSGLRARELTSTDFTGWLRQLMNWRRAQSPAGTQHAIQRGIDASLAAGTTLLADISSGGGSWRELLRAPIRATVFAELLGLRSSRAAETATAARQFLEWTQTPTEPAPHDPPASLTEPFTCDDGTTIDPLPAVSTAPNQRLQPGLSPHAPYSTCPLLYDLAADWSRRSHAPITTHLAETPHESRLLTHGDGPFREFLAGIAAWDDTSHALLAQPIDYIDGDRTRDAQWLIAHGNYLGEPEIARLAGSASRRSVVFCPRTHAYFAHTRHPYSKMLDAGLTVCLGSDSLASTPSLSILDEMRFLARRDPRLAGYTLLHMATLAGARALGRDASCGSVTPGKFADLAVVRLPDRVEPDPFRLLLDSDEPVLRTIIAGRTVYELRSLTARPRIGGGAHE